MKYRIISKSLLLLATFFFSLSSEGEIVAEWRFDESSWNGTVGEVLDSSGNNYHGDAINSGGLPTTEDSTPVSSGSPGSCRYGAFNGRSDGYVEIADSGLNSPFDLLTFSVSVWVNPNSWPSSDLATIVSKDENFEFHLNSNGQIFWWWGGGARSLQSSVRVPTNQWSHIAITYEEGEQHIYLNGVSVANRATASGITLNNDSVFIGTDWNFHSRRFDGLIDEVRIYDGPLSAAEVQAVMNDTHDCAGGATLSYFEIDVGAGASVCDAQQITITARDTDDNVFESYIGRIDLSTSSNNGTWSLTNVMGDATGSLSPGSSDSGQASYSFEASGADAGQITLNFENTHAETVTITVSDAGEGVSSPSDPLRFSENAFVIETNDTLGDDSIAGRPHQFTVSMVGRDPSDPNYPDSDCGVLEDYNANAVKAWISRSANDPAGANPSLSNQNQSHTIVLQNAEGAAETLNLNFSSGVANVRLATSDVGEYRLNMLDDAMVYAQTAIRGSSNLLTTRPFGFLITVPSNTEAATASGSVFVAAGQTFSVDVQAKAWHTNDDLNDDGVPDFYQEVTTNWADNANFSGADIFSFGQEATNESLLLSATQIAPSLGSASVLGGTSRIDTFSSGAGSRSDVYIDDVGIFEIQATLSDAYLSATASATSKANSASVQVGRFTPAYYTLSGQRVIAACEATSFSYLSEDFQAEFTVQALSARGTVTPSYAGDFAKLTRLNASDFGGVDDAVPTNLSARVAMSEYTLSWLAGEAVVATDIAIARANALEGPYTGFTLGLALSDSDGIGLRSSDLNLDVDGDALADLIELGRTDLYFGRLVLPNAHGPESAALAAKLHTEFWNGSAWSQMTEDSCSAIAQSVIRFPDGTIDNPANRNVALGSNSTSASFLDSSSGAINIIGGNAGLSFSAPGAGNTGKFTIDIDLTAYPWLRFDWNQDSSFDDAALPSAEISFGSYRGHDRIIYWHEVFN